ncbi:MAG: symmetrical bis(5'-nucleosyl)-tetraphosphatase [Gammaproteobacteria bacterium]|nr:symmetrical bis(5'-nucleosyl)-tetraphosphatase [Gammaproteobacteria bacterium]
MPTFAIGDVQGCLGSLEALLEKTGFDANRDHLWFTGDLVNRGPDNLGVLRLVRSLGDRAVTVLGNHDLHLLALRHCPELKPGRRDTLDDVLQAPDRDVLLDWLRQRPLFHHDAALGFSLVHAGLPVEWSIGEALAHAREVQAALRAEDPAKFLCTMYGNKPARWRASLTGEKRLRYITNAFTRMRYCHAEGQLDFETKEGLDTAPGELLPWFMLPGRASQGTRVIFGHWSTLRLDATQGAKFGVYPLDTGAVWGGTLSALCLEDGRRFSVPGLAQPPS